MAVKSLKEFQFPGSADSYTFDATLFDGKTTDLFALLGGNNEFAGKNVFSGITAIHDSEGDMTFGAKSFVLTSPEGDPIGESVLPSSDDGGQFFLAWANDESNADLSLYAKTSDLSSYVTNTSLTDTLKSYVTSSSLTSTLGSYVTKTSLTTTLGDYVTKTSLTSTLGGYAKLSANNAFTGTNSFSNAISVDTINSKATGNSIARMYYDADKAYKVLLGSVARQITLLGNTDRPYYAKDGEAFNAHSLALSEDLNGYASLSGSNAFSNSNTFKKEVTFEQGATFSDWGAMAQSADGHMRIGIRGFRILFDGMDEETYYYFPYTEETSWIARAGTQADADLANYVKKSEFVPPVGTILAFADGTQPASLYANTTWQKIEGRFIMGADSTYKAGTTGGSASHTHNINGYQAHANVGLTSDGRVSCSNGQFKGSTQVDGRSIGTGKTPDVATGWDIAYTATLEGNTVSTGNIPPYIAYNLWVRTA